MDFLFYLEKLDKIFNIDKAASIVRQRDTVSHYKPDESGWIVLDNYIDTKDWPAYFKYHEVIADGWHDKYLMNILSRMYKEANHPIFLVLFSVPGGRGLWTSMFGAKVEYKEKGGVWSFPQDGVTIDELIDKGVPDVSQAGMVPQVLDISRFFLDRLVQFENLSKLMTVAIDPDSIFETAMALFGQKLMEDMLLRPEIVKKFFDIVQETKFRYCSMLQKLFEAEIKQNRMFMFKNPFSQYNSCRLVEDSAIMLSPELYKEFCQSYNEAMFECYAPGEGYVHFCGDGNNIMDAVLETKGLRGVHPGQTEFYDIEKLYPKLAEKKVSITFSRFPDWSDDDVKNLLENRPGIIIHG